MDTSKQGIKLLLVSIIMIVFGQSCGNSEIKKESELYIKQNFKTYHEIYNSLNDSTLQYVDSSLASFTSEYLYGWVVDSLICLNKTNDLLVAIIIENPNSGKGMKMDNAMEILGKKIHGKWYFFKAGETLAIPRAMYGYTETNPPSQYFLSQIARKNMLESALIEKNGEYVVSDEWIDNKFYQNGYGVYNTHAEYDSVHWTLIMDKWKHKIDTNEYKPFKKKPNS